MGQGALQLAPGPPADLARALRALACDVLRHIGGHQPFFNRTPMPMIRPCSVFNLRLKICMQKLIFIKISYEKFAYFYLHNIYCFGVLKIWQPCACVVG